MLEPLLAAMLSRDPTIRKAIETTGNFIDPVRVVDMDEAAALYRTQGQGRPSRSMVGFRLKNDPVVYINSMSDQYKKASMGSELANVMLAGSLLHERVHNHPEDGELPARRYEADFLQSKVNTLPKLIDQAYLNNYIAPVNGLATSSIKR